MQKTIIVCAVAQEGPPGRGRLCGFAIASSSKMTTYNLSHGGQKNDFDVATQAYYVNGPLVSDAKYEQDMVAYKRGWLLRYSDPEIIYSPLPPGIVSVEGAQTFAKAEAERRISEWQDSVNPTKRAHAESPFFKLLRW